MATFKNMATLFYNDNSVNSNIVSGELRDVLSVTKSAITDTYTAGDKITYAVNLVNTGSTAFSGLTVRDNLGEYTFGALSLNPLTYVTGSAAYFEDGVKQATPAVTPGPPLTFTGISVPANGNTTLIYQAYANSYAPLDIENNIVNTVTVSGGGLSSELTASETVSTRAEAVLTITKAVNPTVVTGNGQLTYTFTIQNIGNTAALAADNVLITDTFNPILNPITVTYNGELWTAGTEYTYNSATGEFATTAGRITVPAASYTQNADGTWIVTPGVSTLTVTGTV